MREHDIRTVLGDQLDADEAMRRAEDDLVHGIVNRLFPAVNHLELVREYARSTVRENVRPVLAANDAEIARLKARVKDLEETVLEWRTDFASLKLHRESLYSQLDEWKRRAEAAEADTARLEFALNYLTFWSTREELDDAMDRNKGGVK